MANEWLMDEGAVDAFVTPSSIGVDACTGCTLLSGVISMMDVSDGGSSLQSAQRHSVCHDHGVGMSGPK